MKIQHVRSFFLIVIAFLCLTLYMKWQALSHPPEKKSATTAQQNTTNINDTNTNIDSNFNSTTATTTIIDKGGMNHTQPLKLIKVSTDVFNVWIDESTGSIAKLSLLNYKTSLKQDTPLVLLTEQKNKQYMISSGFTQFNGSQTRPLYTADKTSYALKQDQNNLTVTLTAQKNGLIYIKKYRFKKGSYDIHLEQSIKNTTTQPIEGNFYGQIFKQSNPEGQSFLNFSSHITFNGGVFSSKNNHYEKISFSDMGDDNTVTTKQGWMAILQHYFISAWVPSSNEKNTYVTKDLGDHTYLLQVNMPQFKLDAGKQYTQGSQLYVGPIIAKNLQPIAKYLDLTVDYGWFWFISNIIFWIMSWIYAFVGNWGVAIILVTCLIKLLFYPLSAKSFRSMAKMRLLQPKITQLKERFGDDRQAMTKGMMELYKKEKVNPVSGCLPMLIQIPVFIALYWVIMESVQLRQAPFIFWIHDLSAKDPYYILPLIMGLAMFLQQRLSPSTLDPAQQKVMMLMPVIFVVMFSQFPSGLVLYWCVNTLLGILQQWMVNRSMEKNVKMKKKAYRN